MRARIVSFLTLALGALLIGGLLWSAWGQAHFWPLVAVGAVAVLVGWLFASRKIKVKPN
jgi:hypothetical protein